MPPTPIQRNITSTDAKNFSQALLGWAKKYGRHNLPWQNDPTAYRVWVSEVMLQQTQVATVIPYYQAFLTKFPTINDLASAEEEVVLALWSGLGYYARARNLHKCARQVVENYNGVFPKQAKALESLPGIGRSTAGAIASLAMNQSNAILDGNCKRVYSRFFMVQGHYSQSAVLKILWELAEAVTPEKQTAQFNQAIMDLGSMVCTRTKPQCLTNETLCPLSDTCLAFKQNRIPDFPQKKTKKRLKLKEAIFLIVQHRNHHQNKLILLEKRPPHGIWGGLWSFPEFKEDKDSQAWLKTKLKDYTVSEQPLEKSHVFTHFKLNYQEQYIKTYSPINRSPLKASSVAETDNLNWFDIDDALQLALPTPIKKTLLSIHEENSNVS